MGYQEEFERGVHWVAENVRFDKDKTVSLFETNIRLLGGLLSAHLLAITEPTKVPGMSLLQLEAIKTSC
jgi:mannosidase alpha-like ER degradation enhancer 1